MTTVAAATEGVKDKPTPRPWLPIDGALAQTITQYVGTRAALNPSGERLVDVTRHFVSKGMTAAVVQRVVNALALAGEVELTVDDGWIVVRPGTGGSTMTTLTARPGAVGGNGRATATTFNTAASFPVHVHTKGGSGIDDDVAGHRPDPLFCLRVQLNEWVKLASGPHTDTEIQVAVVGTNKRLARLPPDRITAALQALGRLLNHRIAHGGTFSAPIDGTPAAVALMDLYHAGFLEFTPDASGIHKFRLLDDAELVERRVVIL